MRKTFFTYWFFCFLLIGFTISLIAQNKVANVAKNKGAKSSMVETWTPIQQIFGGGAIFIDDMNGVNDLAGLAARGWFFDDVDGAGLTAAFQGNPGVFSAFEGPDTGYVGQNFNGAFDGGLLIDQWLISPEVTVETVDVLQFWHRSTDGSIYPDPLEVWVSTTAGTTAADFDIQLDAFNASTTGWAQWVGNFPSAGTVRFAVRYYTTDGGPGGNESDYIGLDLFEVGEPCIKNAATNPDPADGATDVDINLAAINWTNGIGTTNVEVWFDGVMVYDGTAVTSYNLPVPLDYSTKYNWRIVGKNDACLNVIGPLWSFTTIANPDEVCLFEDHFDADISQWTEVGPLGIGNWSWSGSNNAEGSNTGELNFTWTPSFVGDSYLMSDVIPSDGHGLTISFAHFVNWYADPMTVGLSYTIDDGATWTAIWEISPNDNVGPEVVELPAPGSANFRLGFYWSGDSFNIDDWWIDDVFACYIVPVELTSFTANVNKRNVILNWSTATETNNMGFEVQRGSNGSDYSRITFVEGHGTVTETQNYSYSDKNLDAGTYTYRLKQVDFDGTSEFSDAVEVKILAPNIYALKQNFPNPFNPGTKITFSLAADSKVTLTVFDVLGQEVTKLITTNMTAGVHEVNFNAVNLNSGVYFYRINATGVDGTNFTSVKKMILTK